MIRLTHLYFQHIEKCYTLSFFSINNDELIEFSPLTSCSLLFTRCYVRQCAYTFPFILITSNFNCFIYDAHVSTLPKNLSPSWTTQNFCSIQVTIGPMTLSSTSIIPRKSPSSTCHHYILTHTHAFSYTPKIYLYIYIWTRGEEMHINEKKSE